MPTQPTRPPARCLKDASGTTTSDEYDKVSHGDAQSMTSPSRTPNETGQSSGGDDSGGGGGGELRVWEAVWCGARCVMRKWQRQLVPPPLLSVSCRRDRRCCLLCLYCRMIWLLPSQRGPYHSHRHHRHRHHGQRALGGFGCICVGVLQVPRKARATTMTTTTTTTTTPISETSTTWMAIATPVLTPLWKRKLLRS